MTDGATGAHSPDLSELDRRLTGLLESCCGELRTPEEKWAALVRMAFCDKRIIDNVARAAEETSLWLRSFKRAQAEAAKKSNPKRQRGRPKKTFATKLSKQRLAGISRRYERGKPSAEDRKLELSTRKRYAQLGAHYRGPSASLRNAHPLLVEALQDLKRFGAPGEYRRMRRLLAALPFAKFDKTPATEKARAEIEMFCAELILRREGRAAALRLTGAKINSSLISTNSD